MNGPIFGSFAAYILIHPLFDFAGGKKLIDRPFWHESFTETYEDHEEDVSTTTTEPLPFFEDDYASNVTAQLGSKVYLHCRVHDLGEKTVRFAI
ncbi:hypothetical protein EVAR_57417_1 [Eumeta japonica]|uniref:Uncharacterized protein n=1 Tax=Eumeta variegata TaxID=151549 RepID=A0A4C1Y9A0_EUMVA|nr:hypothetical protein EVAR_57417_1 [Eumeta japonica]